MSEVLGSTAKKYASRYLQLKVGHGAIGTYLAKIGVIETPQCWWCGQAEKSVEHLYTKCRRWRKERRKLIRSLHTEGISWQGRAQRKGLAELLANEQAVGPLLEFLKSTEVGGREGARVGAKKRSDRGGTARGLSHRGQTQEGKNLKCGGLLPGETVQKWTKKRHQARLDHVCRDAQVCHNPKGCRHKTGRKRRRKNRI